MGLYYIPRDDYLMHHGVKGQKWGVRNDPERIGRRRSGLTTAQDINRKRGLSKGAKIALGVGAGALATAAIAGGGYALYKTGAGKTALKAGSSIIKSAMREAKTTGQAAKAYVQSRNGKKLFSSAKSARASAKVFQQTPGAKELTRAARRQIIKDYAGNAGAKVRGIAKHIGNNTVKGAIDGLKEGGKGIVSYDNVKQLVNDNVKRGVNVAAGGLIAGGIGAATKTAISGKKMNRQELTSYLTRNPNKQ